jgi:hypothetical protein
LDTVELNPNNEAILGDALDDAINALLANLNEIIKGIKDASQEALDISKVKLLKLKDDLEKLLKKYQQDVKECPSLSPKLKPLIDKIQELINLIKSKYP